MPTYDLVFTRTLYDTTEADNYKAAVKAALVILDEIQEREGGKWEVDVVVANTKYKDRLRQATHANL
jgi:hypothetical protein